MFNRKIERTFAALLFKDRIKVEANVGNAAMVSALEASQQYELAQVIMASMPKADRDAILCVVLCGLDTCVVDAAPGASVERCKEKTQKQCNEFRMRFNVAVREYILFE